MDKEVLQQIIARTATEKKQNRNVTISSLTKVGVILYLIKKGLGYYIGGNNVYIKQRQFEKP